MRFLTDCIPLNKKSFYLWLSLLFLLGIGVTCFIDSLEHKKWQAKIEKEAHNSLEILRKEIKGSFGCIKYVVMEKIASELGNHPDKEREIVRRYTEKMKPWRLIMDKDLVFEKKDNELLLSFLEAVKKNPFGKVLAIEKLNNKAKILYMAYPVEKTGRILIADGGAKAILDRECSSELLSKYYVDLYGMDLFGGKDRELLMGDGKIPQKAKNSFSLVFPTTKHRHNLMLKIMPKEGTGPSSPNRFSTWGFGGGITSAIIFFLLILQKKNVKLEESKSIIEADKRKLHELSIKDPLTNIFNRRHFEKLLHAEFQRAKRYKRPLSCIMTDIDYFKNINDTYGHECGDIVLKEITNLLKGNLRGVDVLARYGGEEFVVLLPETDGYDAVLLAERLRIKVENNSFSCKGQKLPVALSLGVSTMNENLDIACHDSLVALADNALYQAKRSGRNRVIHVENLENKKKGGEKE